MKTEIDRLRKQLQQKDQQIADLDELVTSYQIALDDYQIEMEKLAEENRCLKKLLLPEMVSRQ